MKNIKVLFYKKYKKTLLDYIIYLFQKIGKLDTYAIYTHVEIYIDNKLMSSSYIDNGVRTKEININTDNWDYVEFKISNKQYLDILNIFKEEEGKKYDLMNIFFKQALDVNIEDKDKWICSEICAYALSISNVANLKFKPIEYNPALLAFELDIKYGLNKFKKDM